MSPCPLCEENDRQRDGQVPGAVAELETGWVRLHSRQRFVGAAFFVAKECVREVYHLDEPRRSRHLGEMSGVAASIDAVFAPAKLNIESLGNSVQHLHWWITPRHRDDPHLDAPIWEDHEFLRELRANEGHADPSALERAAGRLRDDLGRRGLIAR
jgi:diadenosine tetraphosphate (Ap4A) HIT family hydrolase